MFAGTLASRITGLVRNVLFLSFGLTALADTYNVANTAPNQVYELVAGGVLSAVLIPLFTALDRKNTRKARDGINAIVTLTAVTLLVAVGVVVLGAPLIVRFFFDKPEPGQVELGSQLLRMFAPQVAIYGFVTLATAALNARKRFGAPMFAPVLNNVMMITVFIWALRLLDALAKRTGTTRVKVGVQAVLQDSGFKRLLGFGTTMGVLAMALVLIPSLRSAQTRWRWHWNPRHPAVRELFRLSAWTIGYVISNQIALTYITRLLTVKKGDQSAYSFSYATLFLLPHGLFAVSIMTAIQPNLARAFLDRKRGLFRAELSRAIRNILVVMIPAAVGYLVLAPTITDILRSLTSGKRFTPESASLLGRVLQAFVIGLPAFSVYLLLMNALKAMRNTKDTFMINGIECVINMVLAYIAYRLHTGVVGIAFSFALAYIVSVVIAARHVSRKIRGIDAHRIIDATVRIGIAAGLMGLVTEAVRRLLSALFIGSTAFLELPTFLGRLLVLFTATLFGGLSYFVIARVVGVTELDAVMRMLSRKLPARFRAKT
jgi:putative peptidoglycan lipid II flippase